MKTFIDFGPGNKWYDARLKHVKFGPDWHIIAIDMREEPEWNFMYDEWIVDSFANEIDIPKADEWRCSSVFEHIKSADVEACLLGIYNKVKNNSVGHIHIDLTDHRSGFFNHYDKSGPYAPTIRNTIRYDEWLERIGKYFTFTQKFLPGIYIFNDDEILYKWVHLSDVKKRI